MACSRVNITFKAQVNVSTNKFKITKLDFIQRVLVCFDLFPEKITLISLTMINLLNAELNPICHLLALVGAHHILHFSRVRVKGAVFLMNRQIFLS